MQESPDVLLLFKRFSHVSLRTAAKPKIRTNKGSAAQTQEFKRLGRDAPSKLHKLSHTAKICFGVM